MIDKQTLYNEYIVQKKSMKQISQEHNIAVGTIYNYMKKYGIESRPKITDESINKMVEAKIGKPSKLKGIRRSNEVKAKIKESKIGKFKKPSEYGGHKKKRRDGYISVYNPKHHRANKDGYVMEHILIMENKIGRFLTNEECVHHIDRNRSNNDISNLLLLTKKEHARLHATERHKEKRKF